jgi:hypothetical protein
MVIPSFHCTRDYTPGVSSFSSRVNGTAALLVDEDSSMPAFRGFFYDFLKMCAKRFLCVFAALSTCSVLAVGIFGVAAIVDDDWNDQWDQPLDGLARGPGTLA